MSECQIARLRRLNAEYVTAIEDQKRQRAAHAAALAGYLAERDAFQSAHPGTSLPAVLRYQIEAGEGGVAAADLEIAEFEHMLAQQRAGLAEAVGEPVEVFAICAFTFVDQDGSERLCGRYQAHRLPPPAAALAIDASVAFAANSIAGIRARDAAGAGELDGPEKDRVRLGDPVGFGFADN